MTRANESCLFEGRRGLGRRDHRVFSRLQGVGPRFKEAGFAGSREECRVLMTDFSATQIASGFAKLTDFLQNEFAGPAATAADRAVIDSGAFDGRAPIAETATGRGDERV